MYNEKIEGLIKAALADGVLTEKEKQVLFKRAQEQGIDLDEFEMVLDARLVELQKEEKEKASKSAPKSDKYGDVRRCPECEALIPALATSCPHCGYEFAGLESNLSSQKLAEKIEKINQEYENKIASIEQSEAGGPDKRWSLKKSKIDTIAQTIKTFPIPNTKADLFEFITSMQTKMLSEFIFKAEGEAYFTKYNEAIIKSKAMCANDPMFASIISEHPNIVNQYNKVSKKQKGIGLKPGAKMGVFSAIVFAIVIIIAVIANLSANNDKKLEQIMSMSSYEFNKFVSSADSEKLEKIYQELGVEDHYEALELMRNYIMLDEKDKAYSVYKKINSCMPN